MEHFLKNLVSQFVSRFFHNSVPCVDKFNAENLYKGVLLLVRVLQYFLKSGGTHREALVRMWKIIFALGVYTVALTLAAPLNDLSRDASVEGLNIVF